MCALGVRVNGSVVIGDPIQDIFVIFDRIVILLGSLLILLFGAVITVSIYTVLVTIVIVIITAVIPDRFGNFIRIILTQAPAPIAGSALDRICLRDVFIISVRTGVIVIRTITVSPERPAGSHRQKIFQVIRHLPAEFSCILIIFLKGFRYLRLP